MAGKLIKKYDTDFFITTNEIFRDKRLSLKELGLLCQLLSLPNDWDFNIKGLSTLHTDNYDSVRTGLIKLEEYGYLTRVQKSAGRGKFGTIDYFIYANPNDNEDWLNDKKRKDISPILENPITVNPIMDKPITDVQRQYNNNQYSINQSSTCTNQNLNDLFNEKTHEFDGMLLSDKQYNGINDLVKMANIVIDTTKDDLLHFLHKLYDDDAKTFLVNGSPIYDIKAFVISTFKAKTQRTANDLKAIKQMANNGNQWAIDYMNENSNEFIKLENSHFFSDN